MAIVMVVKLVTHNTGRRPVIHSVIVLTVSKIVFSTRQNLTRNPCNKLLGQSLSLMCDLSLIITGTINLSVLRYQKDNSDMDV